MCITIQFSHRNQPFLLFRLIILYYTFFCMSIVLSNISSFSISTAMCNIESCQLLQYQESKAGNSSRHLKRMGEFLQCYVKTTSQDSSDIWPLLCTLYPPLYVWLWVTALNCDFSVEEFIPFLL